PAVFLGTNPCTLAGVTYPTCSTTANQNQRRRFSLGNPATAQYFADMLIIDSGGKASYNGLLLNVQHRPMRGVTISGNYTWAHCTIVGVGNEVLRSEISVANNNPDSRRFDRGNCQSGGSDIRQFLNTTSVIEMPQFSNRALRIAGSGWRFSPVFKIRSGD